MNLWHHLYVFVFVAGMIVTLCLTPLFQKLAEITGFMDKPQGEGHKGHGKAIPFTWRRSDVLLMDFAYHY